jgi:hypothetical protein
MVWDELWNEFHTGKVLGIVRMRACFFGFLGAGFLGRIFFVLNSWQQFTGWKIEDSPGVDLPRAG